VLRIPCYPRNDAMSSITSITRPLIKVFHDACRVSLDLFKIMVPVIILVKILQELGLIRYIAIPLGPVMEAAGLPAEMGLVWATAILNNLYTAIIVFLSLVRDTPITTAQATVLCTMMLVAHNLPIELKIAQRCGPRLMFQAVSRFGSALLLGWLLNIGFMSFGLLQGPVSILIERDAQEHAASESLVSWAAGEAQNLLSVFLIILGLLLLMKVLRKLRIIDAVSRVLRPLLSTIGIGPKATAITVIGLTMGIAYGGGLIIHEARSGEIGKEDIFYSLTLMGISHSFIEDTLLMVTIGGHLSGLLCARFAFSMIVVAFLVRVCAHLTKPFCDRFLWGGGK
jgi:hypothetical protein